MVLTINLLSWALRRNLRSARHPRCWALGFFTTLLLVAVTYVVGFVLSTAARFSLPPVILPRGRLGQGGVAPPSGRAAEQPAGLGVIPAGQGAGTPLSDCTASSSSWPTCGDPSAWERAPGPRRLGPMHARAMAVVADSAVPPTPRAVPRRLPAPGHIGHVACISASAQAPTVSGGRK